MSSPNSSPSPRVIRLYLCASIGDMQAERELLASYVLPELNDRCRDRNVQLELVDVRSDAPEDASPAQLAAAAMQAIDECRPWFLAFLGDKCDVVVEDTAKPFKQYPALADRSGASLLELEIAHGALHGEGSETRFVYVRDDRFLREVPEHQRANYSSEEIDDIERLEALKAQLRNADVKLVQPYPCRWDKEGECITDLEELGKQLLDDLHDAVLQEIEPATAMSVLEEPTNTGAAAAMINSGGPSNPAARDDDDDDDFDLDMEDVLDMSQTDLDPASSASAVEGVELLDFLEDDEPTGAGEKPSNAAAFEPTLDLSAAPADDEPLEFNEDDFAEEVAAADEEAADEEWDFDEVAPIEDDAIEQAVADGSSVAPSEPTVTEAEKTRSIPPPNEDELLDEFAVMENAQENEQSLASEPADAGERADAGEDADTVEEESPLGEFQFAEQAEEKSPPETQPVAEAAAPAVQAASLASKPARKKSAVPAIVVTLLVLVLLAGGSLGGLYYAGMLSPGDNSRDTSDNLPALPAGQENGLTRAKRITEHTNKLTELVQQAKPLGGEVDAEKLAAAQAYLDKLVSEEPAMLEEVPIQELQERMAALTKEHEAVGQAERNRVREFRTAYDSAESLQDRQLLEAARQLARTEEEINLVAALDAEITQHEQQQAAANAAKQKQADALTAMAESVHDADLYDEKLSAYIKAFPADPRTADFEKVQEAEWQKLVNVIDWNKLLEDWSKDDLANLTPQEAAMRASHAEKLLEMVLPGSEEVIKRVVVLGAISDRVQEGENVAGALMQRFDSPAAKVSLVLGTKDGRRYYLTERPSKQGDNLLVTYVADLEGKTQEAEIPPADIDRDTTGPIVIAETSQAVREQLAKIKELGWEQAFLNAVVAVQDAKPADEKTKPLDPVIQTQWLTELLDVGSHGSFPFGVVTLDARKALLDVNVNAKFNWADPEAAAAVREKCVEVLAKLPKFAELKPAVENQLKAASKWDVPQRMMPVGVLLKDAEAAGGWKVVLSPSAPEAGALVLLYEDESKSELAELPVGKIEAGMASVNEDLDPQRLAQGRIVYALVEIGTPTREQDTPVEDAPPDAEPDFDFTP